MGSVIVPSTVRRRARLCLNDHDDFHLLTLSRHYLSIPPLMLTPPPSDSSHAGPSVERRPIKRARAVRVCTRCKVQKLKCDREEPCSSCNRASLGHRCVYKAWSNGP
jgi:hypothetical protein